MSDDENSPYYTGPKTWKSDWKYGPDNVPYSNLANAYHALSNAPETRDLFTMSPADTIEVEKGIPAYLDDPDAVYPRSLKSVDVLAVQVWLQHAGLATLSTETTRQAIEMRAMRRQRDRS